MLRRLLESCVLPPLNCLLLIGTGLVLWKWPRKRRLASWLIVGGVCLLWLCCTPAFGGALLRMLQVDPALELSGGPGRPPPADAIVVLSAGADHEAPEYGGPVAGRMTLQRVRYGAFLHRATGVPVLVSGGRARVGEEPLAAMMQAALEREFATPARWVEAESANTYENAEFSTRILRGEGIERIYLVTNAWHMPRARACFESLGIEVVAAPTGLRGPALDGWQSLMPSWTGLRDSALAMHEWVGLLYYAVAY